mmetsp:Transcript_16402/g.40425  ORF Transcript_16402/g.40425 Transcript_16402/m.40425 type:complete len:126 (+) Transcript_16402:1583-1960(+)
MTLKVTLRTAAAWSSIRRAPVDDRFVGRHCARPGSNIEYLSLDGAGRAVEPWRSDSPEDCPATVQVSFHRAVLLLLREQQVHERMSSGVAHFSHREFSLRGRIVKLCLFADRLEAIHALGVYAGS